MNKQFPFLSLAIYTWQLLLTNKMQNKASHNSVCLEREQNKHSNQPSKMMIKSHPDQPENTEHP